MESVQNAASLSKLVKICKYGVWVTAIAIAVTAAMLAGRLAELALCLSDPAMSVFPLDHDGTLIDVIQDSLAAASCLVGCVMLYRICETVSVRGVPFNYDNVRSVRNIAWICIATFFLIIAVQAAMILALDPEIYQFEFPFQILVMGTITYIFSLLFEYGTVLQTESDEFL